MEKIVFHRVSFDVTFCCTLNCKYCCSHVPEFEKPAPHYSYEYLSRAISRFFELVDGVDVFTITGGEPFLHRELAEIVGFAGKYRDRIGRLEVITNGTIFRSEWNLLAALRENRCRVLLDDYGPQLSKKADELERIFNQSEVMYERRYQGVTEKGAYCGGWIDYVTCRENALSDARAKENFQSCTQAHELRCNPFFNGKLYTCLNQGIWSLRGKFEDDPRYYLDLFDDNTPIGEQRKKAKEFLALEMQPACAYCNGFFENSERHVPAQQI